jgi:hypothetical protein
MSLEELLREAHREIGLRPEFYQRLLDAEVLVPVETPLPGPRGTIPAGTTLAIKTLIRREDGVGVIPFYTSPRAVYDGHPLGEKCVIIPVRELFESRPDMYFHINPFSRFGREFYPREVASLLRTGQIDDSMDMEIVADENVVLSAPASPPVELLRALSLLYSRSQPQVRAAFIAECRHPDSEIPATLLIGIDAETDEEQALRSSSDVVREYESRGPIVDLAVISGSDSKIARYFFSEAKPFYERITTSH